MTLPWADECYVISNDERYCISCSSIYIRRSADFVR